MRSILRMTGAVFLFLWMTVGGWSAGAGETVWPEQCEGPVLLGDQLILTCLPERFNGTLLLYAHGYIPPQKPLALPEEEIAPFLPVIGDVLNLGYAFATTSYSKNGYALEQAEGDLNALVEHFRTDVAPGLVDRVLLAGGSEGGIITVMMISIRAPSLRCDHFFMFGSHKKSERFYIGDPQFSGD